MEIKSFNLFYETIYQKLEGNFIYEGFTNIFTGYTQDSLLQLIKKITQKNTLPLPIIYEHINQMLLISNKKDHLKNLFNILDFNKLNSIDAYELFASLSILVEGKFEKYLLIICEIFGTNKEEMISKNEFFYYIDSLFRGLSKIIILKDDKTPGIRYWRLENKIIEETINAIFNENNEEIEYLEKNSFKNKVININNSENKLIFELLEYIQSESNKLIKILNLNN